MARSLVKAARQANPYIGADLHTFIEEYERNYPEEVLHIEKPLDADWEISALAMQLEKDHRFPILICHNVKVDGRRADMPLVTFLMASRQRLSRALGADVRSAGIACYERVQSRQKSIVVSRAQAPVKHVVKKGGEVDVRRFPAPRHHRSDPGRYVTGGFFLTFNCDSRLDNSAMQRGWLAGKDEIRVWLGPSSHNVQNLRQYEERGEDMPAAYWIGHHPLVQLGAQNHIGPNESHYEAAGGTVGAPLRLVPSETLGDDFLVPADAEVVIEGYVPKRQRRPEGPFGEYTRHVGPQRWGPLLKVTAITHRRDAYWDDVMVGHTHWISSLATEGQAFRAVQRAVAGVKAVHVPMSGGGICHIYIQIRKRLEGQGRAAGVAALGAFFNVKHAFVFDEDVDIFDEREVLLALATRFQADRNLLTLPGMTGSPLDPSSLDGTIACKAVFDCTKPLKQPFPERLTIPEAAMKRIEAADIIDPQTWERIPIEPWG